MKLEEFDNLTNSRKDFYLEQMDDEAKVKYWVKAGVGGFLTIIILGMAGCPQYNVWTKGLEGQGELAKAEQNRQIAVNEAKALKEAATFKAQAEVIRSRGVAEANEIVAEGLGGPEGYLRYLFIDTLAQTNCKTIYIPTEAGLPILEAGKR